MLHLNKVLRLNSELLKVRKHVSKNYFASTPTDYEITFKPQFSAEEHQKVLSVLNTSTVEDLKRYKIPQNRIKSIKSWTNKKGAFQSLNEVLEVEGLSVKVLEKLCETIINSKTENDEHVAKLSKKQFISPTVTENLDRLSTVVALHIAPMGMSWTRLNRENHVDNWSFYDFSTLPKKILPVDTFQVAIKILEQLPSGDIYLLESANNSASNNLKSTLLTTQQLELTSMLIALINTSVKHNYTLDNKNKVYFLKSRLPARLFGTLVGQERVSAINKITDLLDNTEDPALPYSSVTLEENLKNQFLSNTAVNKELLGQPLMLAITFMDICVKKIPAAYKAVTLKGK